VSELIKLPFQSKAPNALLRSSCGAKRFQRRCCDVFSQMFDTMPSRLPFH